jgi:putative N6-adenine-specific DNA methylase
VQAHLTATHVSIYLDTSGEALFKRGWRDEKGDAPLKENLAAGILALTGWQPKQPLFDPMCGSGTFLIEAAQIAMGIPSGAIRAGMYDEAGKESTPTRLAYRPLVTSVHGFGFFRLKPFSVGAEQKKWQALKDAVLAEILERRKAFPDAQSLGISGSDINEKLVSMTKSNWQRAQLPGLPVVRQVDALAAKPPAIASSAGEAVDLPGLALLNPPYGQRLGIKGGRGDDRDPAQNRYDDEGYGEDDSDPYSHNIETGRQSAKRSSRESLKRLQAEEEIDPAFLEFMKQFGQHLKEVFGGWHVFILTADMALPGQLRIKESRRTPLFNGPLECRLFRFEMRSKAERLESSSKPI